MLVSGKAVKAIDVTAEGCSIEIRLGYPAAGYFDELKQEVEQALAGLEGIGNLQSDLGDSTEEIFARDARVRVVGPAEYRRSAVGRVRPGKWPRLRPNRVGPSTSWPKPAPMPTRCSHRP